MGRDASLAFAAGSLGGLINSLTVWAAGAAGITAAAGVAIAPELTAGWLYPRIVWGGLWGLLLLAPFAPRSWVLRGLALSLAPSAAQLFLVFPSKPAAGLMGLGLGVMTPLFVLGFNAVFGLVAAFWFRRTRRP